MKSWAMGAFLLSVLAVGACGKKPAGDGSVGGGNDSSGGGDMSSGTMVTTGTGSMVTTGTGTMVTTGTGSMVTTGTGSSTGTGMDCGGGDLGPTCDACLSTNCCTEWGACATGSPCETFAKCASACAKGDMTCANACAANNMMGAQAATDFATCLQGPCKTDCANPMQPGQICASGFVSPMPACGDCLGMSCCNEFTACGKDMACHACALNPMGAGCNMNALLTAANTCGAKSCAMVCK